MTRLVSRYNENNVIANNIVLRLANEEQTSIAKIVWCCTCEVSILKSI